MSKLMQIFCEETCPKCLSYMKMYVGVKSLCQKCEIVCKRCENLCSNVWKFLSEVWKYLVEVSTWPWRCEIPRRCQVDLEIWTWGLTLNLTAISRAQWGYCIYYLHSIQTFQTVKDHIWSSSEITSSEKNH